MEEFKPFNLCCALGDLHARCMVCKRDLCVHCFSSYHVTAGWMLCGEVRLWWQNINGLEAGVVDDIKGRELHPYTGGLFGKMPRNKS